MVTVYRYRDWLAALPATALAAVLLAGGMRAVKPLKPRYDEPVKLQVIEVPPPLPPAPPQPAPRKTNPEPQPKVQPVRKPQPQPTVDPTPQPIQSPPARPAPAKQDAAPTPVAPPSAPPSTPVPAVPKGDAEAEFVAKVRAYLNAVKRYPTGREASLQRPAGTVKVWFVLKRDGTVVDMGIEESSNSTLLDQAARKSVALGQFPAFPEAFLPGEPQHRFVVDLQFKPAGG